MIQTSSLQRVVLFLLAFFLIIAALYYAKPFLVPLCFGGLLSMLFLPLSKWFESKKIPKGLSIILCIIVFVAVITGIIWLISWQITDLTSEATDIETKLKKMVNDIKESIRQKVGISKKATGRIDIIAGAEQRWRSVLYWRFTHRVYS